MSPYTPEYLRLQYQKAIWAELRRHLIEQYVDGDGLGKEELICDQTPYALRVTPHEELHAVVNILKAEESAIEAELSKFQLQKIEIRRVGDVPAKKKEATK